jgi:hypothetical protein
MTKHEIVWFRVQSRVEGGSEVEVFIAPVPGGHLVSTTGPGAPGLCFVPGKKHAVKKLIAPRAPARKTGRSDKKTSQNQKKKEDKKSRKHGKDAVVAAR